MDHHRLPNNYSDANIQNRFGKTVYPNQVILGQNIQNITNSHNHNQVRPNLLLPNQYFKPNNQLIQNKGNINVHHQPNRIVNVSNTPQRYYSEPHANSRSNMVYNVPIQNTSFHLNNSQKSSQILKRSNVNVTFVKPNMQKLIPPHRF